MAELEGVGMVFWEQVLRQSGLGIAMSTSTEEHGGTGLDADGSPAWNGGGDEEGSGPFLFVDLISLFLLWVVSFSSFPRFYSLRFLPFVFSLSNLAGGLYIGIL